MNTFFNHKLTSKDGVILPYILVILLVLVQIISSALIVQKNSDIEVKYLRDKAKLNIAKASVIDYIGWKSTSSQIPWRSAHVKYIAPDSTYYAELESKQSGLFANVVGQITLLNHSAKVDSISTLIATDISSLPMLTILDNNARLAMSGDTKLIGDIAIYSGSINKSTQYNLPAKAAAYHKGEVLDSTINIWDSISFDNTHFEQWLALIGRIPQNPSSNIFKPLSSIGRDTIRHSGIIHLSVSIQNSLIIGNEIIISDSASIFESILCAKKIHIYGNPTLSSQFIASDSIKVNTKHPQINQSTFATFGIGGKQPGILHLQNFDGNMNFYSYSTSDMNASSTITFQQDSTCKTKGVIITNSLAIIQGSFIGKAILGNIAYKSSSTLWIGYAHNLKMNADSSMFYWAPDHFRYNSQLAVLK